MYAGIDFDLLAVLARNQSCYVHEADEGVIDIILKNLLHNWDKTE